MRDEDGRHTMTTLHPESFDCAREIGEAFRSGLITIVNLGKLSDSEGRRIVDFFSGLVFYAQGQIERVDEKVFILTSPGMDADMVGRYVVR